METITTEGNKGKKNFLMKTWKRWHDQDKSKKKMAPEGFIPVYVGPEKQRFTIKTKYVNHPLFMMLLEDAETEYGYNSDGPVLLPCDVDLFVNILGEMEGKEVQPLGCGFAYASCSPFNPSRRLGSHGAVHMAKGYGYYEPLTPSIHP